MNEALKIDIVNNTEGEDFRQLCDLIKKFRIDIFVRNIRIYANLRGYEKKLLVNKAISEYDGKESLELLSNEEVDFLHENVDRQISMAKDLIENTSDTVFSRYYILKDGEKVVSYHFAQIDLEAESNYIEGLRNQAYITDEYAGKSGLVYDTSGELSNTFYTEAMYRDIEKWFKDNHVNYERTTTGVNMMPNIYSYIVAKGFLPLDKNENTIYLGKDLNEKYEKDTLKEVYNLYNKHWQRTDHLSRENILSEIKNDSLLEELPNKNKNNLANCLQKENEKVSKLIRNEIKNTLEDIKNSRPESKHL